MKIINRGQLLALILIGIFSIFLISGCAKLISTESSTVEVKIVDEHYSSAHTTMIFNGKTSTPIYHSAVYKIVVEYDGDEYTINDKDAYRKYSNKIGEYASGTLEIRKYNDGTRKYRIIGLN